jgi:acyl-CoA oxidase
LQLADEFKVTPGTIGSVKAWVAAQTRDVVRLGREIMGGNGMVTDNYCIKAMNDIEAIHTYEGTYEINALVTGRELTGIPAFKPKS